jgi:hypothetical protein
MYAQPPCGLEWWTEACHKTSWIILSHPTLVPSILEIYPRLWLSCLFLMLLMGYSCLVSLWKATCNKTSLIWPQCGFKTCITLFINVMPAKCVKRDCQVTLCTVCLTKIGVILFWVNYWLECVKICLESYILWGDACWLLQSLFVPQTCITSFRIPQKTVDMLMIVGSSLIWFWPNRYKFCEGNYRRECICHCG